MYTDQYLYLSQLQKEYQKYKTLESQLRQFFDHHFGGGINRITLENDIVTVDTTETCRGFIYHETYNIPFDKFNDIEDLKLNLIKYRD